MPSLEDMGMTSLADLMFDDGSHRERGFSTADVILRLLEAYMLTRLVERARRSWYGGITPRVVLYMCKIKKINFETPEVLFAIENILYL